MHDFESFQDGGTFFSITYFTVCIIFIHFKFTSYVIILSLVIFAILFNTVVIIKLFLMQKGKSFETLTLFLCLAKVKKKIQ